ncbi:MAG: GtrA family protein [Lachnospiraceae bacterium]|nr:GtrA family protein [Lachnospiraceae bacterium]
MDDTQGINTAESFEIETIGNHQKPEDNIENTDIDKAGTSEKKGLAALWQIIKFGLVGVSNTLVSQVVYNVVYYLIHNVVSYDAAVQIGNIVAFIISVLNAFFWQSKFVFKESEDGEHRVWWQVLIKTYVAYSFTGLFLNAVLLWFWSKVVHIDQYLVSPVNWLYNNWGWRITAEDLGASLSPILNMFITIPLNYIINKFWAYRQKKKQPESED